MGKLSKKIIAIFQPVGLFYKESRTREPLESNLYQLRQGEDVIREHRDFLLRLEEAEEKRLNSIDAKTSQLISQTGIIFSLLSLFIPVIMDKAAGFNLAVKCILIVILVLAAFFYLLTIHNALKNYRINKYSYIRPSSKNVLDLKDRPAAEFRAEEVRDLLSGTNKNIHNNNLKGTNLLHSYTAFKTANTLTGLLVVLFSISILFYIPEKETVSINGPVEIKNLQPILKDAGKRPAHLDTLTLIVRDSLYHIPAKK